MRDRCLIATFLSMDAKVKIIADRSGRHRSTIYREIKRKLARYNISLRSDEINLRQTLGHWEGDTIRFQQDQKTCVTTLVERKSRYVCLRKNKDKKT